MGSQRVGHDWATELNWIPLSRSCFPRLTPTPPQHQGAITVSQVLISLGKYCSSSGNLSYPGSSGVREPLKGSVKRHIFLEKGILLWVTSGFIAGFSLHEHKEPFDTEQRRLSSLEVSGSAFYSWRACILNQMGTCLHDMSFPSPLTYLPKEIDVPVRLIWKDCWCLFPDRWVGDGEGQCCYLCLCVMLVHVSVTGKMQ